MTDQDSIALPGVLAEIAEVAGFAAALQVARAKGGLPAYIPLPEHLREGHWLVEACGEQAARRIAERIGGGEVKIPLGPVGSRAKIWATIQRGIAEGKTAPEIAALAGVDITTVKRHRRGQSGKKKTDDGQGSLF